MSTSWAAQCHSEKMHIICHIRDCHAVCFVFASSPIVPRVGVPLAPIHTQRL